MVIRETKGFAQCWAWKDKKAAFKEICDSLEEAERKVRAAIDAELGPAVSTADAGVAAYVTALEAIRPITEGQRRMLAAHYRAPNKIITATQLAKAAGYADYRGANIQYGALGKLILWQSALLCVPLRGKSKRRTPR